MMRLVPILSVFVASYVPLNEPARDQLVEVGTHRLYIHCLGTGRPTAVIDTGVGERYERVRDSAALLPQASARICTGTPTWADQRR